MQCVYVVRTKQSKLEGLAAWDGYPVAAGSRLVVRSSWERSTSATLECLTVTDVHVHGTVCMRIQIHVTFSHDAVYLDRFAYAVQCTLALGVQLG